jgi:hypothetical protein
MKTNEEILKKAIKAYENIDRKSSSMIMYSESNCDVIGKLAFIRNSKLLAVYDFKEKYFVNTSDLSIAKKWFLIRVERTEFWRYRKADQFPYDAQRNHEAATSLKGLNYYGAAMSEEHPLFELLCLPFEQIMIKTDDEIRMYGFQVKWRSPEQFIEHLIENLIIVILSN